MSDGRRWDGLQIFATAVFTAGLLFLIAAEIWLVVSLPDDQPWGGPDEPMHLSVAEYIAKNLQWPRWDSPELIRYQNGASYATFSSFNYWIEGILLRLVGVPRLSSLLLFCVYAAVVFVAFLKSRLAGLIGLATFVPQVLFVFSYVNAEPWTATVAALLGVAIARFRAAPLRTGNIVFLLVAAAACISCRTHLWALGFIAVLYVIAPRVGPVLRENRRAVLLGMIPALAVGLWWPLTSYFTHDGDLTGRVASRWAQERFGDPVATSARTWENFPVAVFVDITARSFYGLWGWLSIPLPNKAVYVFALLLGGLLILTLWAIQRRFVALYAILFTANVALMLVYSITYDFQPQGRQLFAAWFLMAGMMLYDFSTRRLLETLSSRMRWAIAVWLAAFVGLNAYAITSLAAELRRVSSTPVETAFVRLKHGQLDRARGSFEEAIRQEPRNVRAHAGLGHVLARLGLVDEAQASFQKAIELDPENASARIGLGTILVKQGEYAAAIREFETAVRLQPDSVDPLYRLAVAHAYNQDRAAALNVCKTALEIDPRHAATLKLRRELINEANRQP